MMEDIQDHWMTEYRGQFSYMVPKEYQPRPLEKYAQTAKRRGNYTHPSSRIPPVRQEADSPPHPIDHDYQYDPYSTTASDYAHTFYHQGANQSHNGAAHADHLRHPRNDGVQFTDGHNHADSEQQYVNEHDDEINPTVHSLSALTLPRSPTFQTPHTVNRHTAICSGIGKDGAPPRKKTTVSATKKPKKGKDVPSKTTNKPAGKLYHPKNYDNGVRTKEYSVNQVEPSPTGAPPPRPPPAPRGVVPRPPTPPYEEGHVLPPAPPPLPSQHQPVAKITKHTSARPVTAPLPPHIGETVPPHPCTYRWHNPSDLYWADHERRSSPPLECSMCLSRPHPNAAAKNFDPSNWMELNPKFYKYMPAESLRNIPAAGKVVPPDSRFVIADMWTRHPNRVTSPAYLKA